MIKCQCSDLQDEYEGKRLVDLPDLRDCTKEVSVDYKTWETKYICNVCGQYWLEYYKPRGHSEIPMIMKME